jgi:nucleoside-diphosphate-sugar epimerase
MTTYLLMGASGRLGRICRNIFLDSGQLFSTVNRDGDIEYEGKLVGNLFQLEFNIPGAVFIIDASIDYSSVDNLNAYEEVKRAFIFKIKEEARLEAVVAFSSGAIEFSDEFITDVFYQNYKNQKIKLEHFLNELERPFLCLRIYTLIGPESYKNKTTGWVSVLDKALKSDRVEISDPAELRSWVSEETVAKHICKFISMPIGKNILTPISGAFTLSEVVAVAATIKKENIKIFENKKNKWLSVPYVSNRNEWIDEVAFPDYLLNLYNGK